MSRPERGPASSALLLLAAGVLLLLGAGAALIPAVSCPDCEGLRWFEATQTGGVHTPPFPQIPCAVCSGRGRVTLLKGWQLRRR
jgi:hypothetical protein